MKLKTIRSLLFVETRANASKVAQDIVKTLWTWEEKSVPQWIADLAEFHVLDAEEVAKRAELRSAAAAWDANLSSIKVMTKDVVRLARIRYRNNPDKLDQFKVLRTNGKSRAAIYDQGRAVEKAWLAADPTWVAMPGVTTAVLGSALAGSLAQGELHATKRGLHKNAATLFRNKARRLDADNVAWYGAATTHFKEGTDQGDMIRSTVPTTYNPPPPVGQAVLSHLMVQGTTVHFDCDAPHATKFTYMYQAPGSPLFVVVTALTKEKSLTMENLVPGVHRFKAFGRNSGGEGAESAVLETTIFAEAVA